MSIGSIFCLALNVHRFYLLPCSECPSVLSIALLRMSIGSIFCLAPNVHRFYLLPWSECPSVLSIALLRMSIGSIFCLDPNVHRFYLSPCSECPSVLSIALLRMSIVESYLRFLLFLIKLSFSDTTVIEGGRERKHNWNLSLLFWETRYSN